MKEMKYTDSSAAAEERLSQEEIEELCSLYSEGRLDMREEKELARVLSHSGYQGEIVEETIFLMGISRISRRGDRLQKGRTVSPVWRIFRISVAAVAAIAMMSSVWNTFFPPQAPVGDKYEVYVSGVRIDDPGKSREMALAAYASSMRFLAKMEALEASRMSEVEEMQRNAERKLAMMEETCRDFE